MPADHVQNKIIAIAAPGEVLLRIINDPICANGVQRLQFPRAVHAGHFSPEVLGKLHRKRARSTARTGLVSTLFEWDADIPPLEEVVTEARRAHLYLKLQRNSSLLWRVGLTEVTAVWFPVGVAEGF